MKVFPAGRALNKKGPKGIFVSPWSPHMGTFWNFLLMAAPECLGLCCWFIYSHKKAESPIQFGPTDSSGQATRLSLNFIGYFAMVALPTTPL